MKSRDIRIREAAQKDFAKVANMHYPVWRQSWNGIVAEFLLDILGSPKRFAAEDYPRTLSKYRWKMWIAESGGQPLGMTIFGPDSRNPAHLLIDALYVAEENQRHGIGGLLLGKVLRSNPSGDVILWCAEQNIKARRFYERNNFHIDGRTFDWEPLPGVKVPHVGYSFHRSADRA